MLGRVGLSGTGHLLLTHPVVTGSWQPDLTQEDRGLEEEGKAQDQE